MRAFLLAALAALIVPAGAGAAVGTVIPPSNPAANQYVEGLPTATGGRPTTPVSRVVPGGTSSASASGAIAASTEAALITGGSDGISTERLANVTAPGTGLRRSHRRQALAGVGSNGGRSHGGGTASIDGPSSGAGSSTRRSSPGAMVLGSLIGSGSPTGLGVGLPLILILSTFGVAVIAWRRRRAS